jgi:hypothetical protein
VAENAALQLRGGVAQGGDALAMSGGDAVAFANIDHARVQIGNRVMQDALVGVVDDLGLIGPPIAILGIQNHMLADDLADAPVAQGGKVGRAGDGMVFAGVEATGFGDVVQQGRRRDERAVEGHARGGQGVGQKLGHPADLAAVVPDVGLHLHERHEPKAFLRVGDRIELRFGRGDSGHKATFQMNGCIRVPSLVEKRRSKKDYSHIGVDIQTPRPHFLGIAFLERIAYLTSESVSQLAS